MDNLDRHKHSRGSLSVVSLDPQHHSRRLCHRLFNPRHCPRADRVPLHRLYSLLPEYLRRSSCH